MDSVVASLEAEQCSKAEVLRIKKKHEEETNELKIGLDSTNKANSEDLKAIQRYQGHLRETIKAFEAAKQQVTEQVGIADCKAVARANMTDASMSAVHMMVTI